jgi:hypothetical protein
MSLLRFEQICANDGGAHLGRWRKISHNPRSDKLGWSSGRLPSGQ